MLIKREKAQDKCRNIQDRILNNIQNSNSVSFQFYKYVFMQSVTSEKWESIIERKWWKIRKHVEQRIWIIRLVWLNRAIRYCMRGSPIQSNLSSSEDITNLNPIKWRRRELIHSDFCLVLSLSLTTMMLATVVSSSQRMVPKFNWQSSSFVLYLPQYFLPSNNHKVA